MSLDAIKPEHIKKRFKALCYGPAATGKTLTAISFPSPYVIDIERGCENDAYVEILEKTDGAVLQTSEYNQIISNIRSLRTQKHHFKTLVIDSLSYLYHMLIQKGEDIKGTHMSAHYTYAKQQIRNLVMEILDLDMNSIIICHEKDKYEKNSGAAMKFEEVIADGPDKLAHMVDVCLHLTKNVKNLKQKSIALVKKTRLQSSFPVGETFPFSFEEISKRYGNDSFTRESIPVELATEDQIVEIKRLISSTKTPSHTVHKWLNKANVKNIEDMPREYIGKCINYLKEQEQSLESDIPIKSAA